jgi:RNA polymerase sigma factor (TIGR02999 family)
MQARSPEPDVTDFLQTWSGGDTRALKQVIPLVYQQLHAIAVNLLHRERRGHTLQATALVNELYVQLTRQHEGTWKDRAHFFSFAAMLMRRILTDHARRSLSRKRGGGVERVPLNEDLPWLGNSGEEILALNRALEVLEKSDERKVRVLEARILSGCTAAETADLLGISKATVDREWTLARAWLYRELTRPASL